MQPRIWHADVFEGSDIPFADRLVAQNGAHVLLEEDLVSFDLRRFVDRQRFDLVTAMPLSGFFFDTLQTAGGWDRDVRGYNFLYTLQYANSPVKGGNTARYEFVFHTEAFGDLTSVWKIRYLPVLSR